MLVEPLAKLLGWQLGETDAVETLLGEEDGSQPLLMPIRPDQLAAFSRFRARRLSTTRPRDFTGVTPRYTP